ncbi:SAM-dependent methyltransferase [Trebonia kvetii]|uniref:SAM-dependent methyltransferase n=1 Tax=Trebonia kvetii TaxID=2480626 RepID=UPI001FEC7AA9|nr:SAM-dependent methyltransferase [Trebonia kvetii]
MTEGESPDSLGPGEVFRLRTEVPHVARVYDYWLNGKDNFTAFRVAAEETIAAFPGIRLSAQANRAFLRRTVRYLAAEEGIRRFLDIGTGLPAADNTHEVSQAVAPETRVVYVDNDPLVLAHARALLTSGPQGATAYLDADLRDTDTILERAARTLDFSRPVAIMLLAILHYIPDLAEASQIVAKLVGAVPSGSFFVVSYAGTDLLPADVLAFEKSLNAHLAAREHHVARRHDAVLGHVGRSSQKALTPPTRAYSLTGGGLGSGRKCRSQGNHPSSSASCRPRCART